jgi:hypothetical protein
MIAILIRKWIKNIFPFNRGYIKWRFSIIKSIALENKLIFHKLKYVVFVNFKIMRKLRKN